MIVCEAGTKRNKKAFKSSQATSNTAQREKTAKHFYTVWSPHDFAKWKSAPRSSRALRIGRRPRNTFAFGGYHMTSRSAKVYRGFLELLKNWEKTAKHLCVWWLPHDFAKCKSVPRFSRALKKIGRRPRNTFAFGGHHMTSRSAKVLRGFLELLKNWEKTAKRLCVWWSPHDFAKCKSVARSSCA